jgi:hypothetical protein
MAQFACAAEVGWPAAIRLAMHYKRLLVQYRKALEIWTVAENAWLDGHLTLLENEANRFNQLREAAQALLTAGDAVVGESDGTPAVLAYRTAAERARTLLTEHLQAETQAIEEAQGGLRKVGLGNPVKHPSEVG